MYINVEIDPDDLNSESWRFWFNHSQGVIVLDWFKRMSRPTKRHKFVVKEVYSRLKHNLRYGYGSGVTDIPAPEIPQHVIERVRAKLAEIPITIDK